MDSTGLALVLKYHQPYHPKGHLSPLGVVWLVTIGRNSVSTLCAEARGAAEPHTALGKKCCDFWRFLKKLELEVPKTLRQYVSVLRLTLGTAL